MASITILSASLTNKTVTDSDSFRRALRTTKNKNLHWGKSHAKLFPQGKVTKT